MASTDDLVKRAQKRGINISESQDGTWHGSYVWNGQEYGLDSDTAEALVDDMEALVECFAQDDTYQLDYNEDLDRYIITVEGSEETFSDQVLAKAFAAAKNNVMARLAQQEEERKAKQAQAEPAKTATASRKRSNGPTAPVEPSPVDAVAEQLPQPVINALVDLLNAIRGVAQVPAGTFSRQAETIEQFQEPEPAPAPKKRGLKKG